MGARAAGFRSPSLSPSGPGRPSLWWTCGRPCLPGSLRRLDQTPAPLAPVIRTCGASACRFRAWRRRCRRYTCAGSLCCLRPPPCPAVGAAVPLSPSYPYSPLLNRWSRPPWFLGWWRGFRSLPAPVCLPPALPLPRWPPRGFRPPGETLPLWGCRCPAATRTPLTLPGVPPLGFLPIRRPCPPPPTGPSSPRIFWPLRRPYSPPPRPPLLRTCQPGFPAGQQSSPLPLTPPHGGFLLPPRRRPCMRPSRCHSCRPPCLLTALPHRFTESPLPSQYVSRKGDSVKRCGRAVSCTV